jgi:hypothetical protein
MRARSTKNLPPKHPLRKPIDEWGDVTVNDYLARRDSEWMGQIYTFLGLTVGVIVHGPLRPMRDYGTDS